MEGSQVWGQDDRPLNQCILPTALRHCRLTASSSVWLAVRIRNSTTAWSTWQASWRWLNKRSSTCDRCTSRKAQGELVRTDQIRQYRRSCSTLQNWISMHFMILSALSGRASKCLIRKSVKNWMKWRKVRWNSQVLVKRTKKTLNRTNHRDWRNRNNNRKIRNYSRWRCSSEH